MKLYTYYQTICTLVQLPVWFSLLFSLSDKRIIIRGLHVFIINIQLFFCRHANEQHSWKQKQQVLISISKDLEFLGKSNFEQKNLYNSFNDCRGSMVNWLREFIQVISVSGSTSPRHPPLTSNIIGQRQAKWQAGWLF